MSKPPRWCRGCNRMIGGADFAAHLATHAVPAPAPPADPGAVDRGLRWVMYSGTALLGGLVVGASAIGWSTAALALGILFVVVIHLVGFIETGIMLGNELQCKEPGSPAEARAARERASE